MDDRIRVAVENNAKWCDLVCRSHGISTSWNDGFWVSRQPSPQFYPEAVTLQRKVSPEQLINELPPGLCSVKDSFADLDLASRGFEQLFDARWIYRVPPVGTEPATGWTGRQRGRRVRSVAAGVRLGGRCPRSLAARPVCASPAAQTRQGCVSGRSTEPNRFRGTPQQCLQPERAAR